MIWKTAAISPRFQHPLNSATPLCERDRPSFSSSHTYKESLCPISLFGGNPKDIFSLFLFPHLQSPLLSRSHFLEHFLPPKDNFPHVPRSRVSPNPTFWINPKYIFQPAPSPKDIFSKATPQHHKGGVCLQNLSFKPPTPPTHPPPKKISRNPDIILLLQI